MDALTILVSIAFSGTAYAMVLYMTSVGLSVTMGLLGVANLAHGAFAVAGGYFLVMIMDRLSVPFGFAVILACLAVGVVSLVLERLLYTRIYRATELDQVVLSMGLIFITTAVAHLAFGAQPVRVMVPAAISGQLSPGAGFSFPIYRIFLILTGGLVFAALWLTIEKTLVGARIRAAVDNRAMAEAIGVNSKQLFAVVFVLGSVLAALGGALGADVLAIEPEYPLKHLVYFLIVVAVGGLGSVKGPFLAALLLGIGDSACKILAPEFGGIFIYVALFLILLARPGGLFGRI
ncbi:branched-chain amino acid ABC transporter permease [Pigmentiphaga litoralis]|uniref:Branched-chain amino acid transport system permease protein n=1 Tax=Pigmentiphaga litoralis TaxID=516702 RepID=A0A7Y9LMA4_9BURK|nr:branched-chain amino acid ABC transporter permease [Pigmentiphaga litoralis]NYE24935.1 branched-chain amino acid transport system permease protein [Pigmentiphaga litoralis]NYE81451.1 branched-chain amino acid transport system permease protein [Pigmentiphaga litoralis]